MPHNGCPRRCSFCNQHTITGQSTQPTPESVRQLLQQSAALLTQQQRQNTQLAFFGGSFTAIDRDYMLSLLQAGEQGVRQYGFHSIRCSTRPDCITPQILDILAQYGVHSVELGAQSMRDDVLLANDRGHTAADVENAAGLIRGRGMELGLQMMTGLYLDTDDGALFTAREFIRLQADTVRIYPTVVLPRTKLYQYYQQGIYRPQTLEQAVQLCAKLLCMFEDANIPVIRCGLHASEGLADENSIGPFHPALRELCESRQYLYKMQAQLQALPPGGYTAAVGTGCISKAVGQHRCNLTALLQQGYAVGVIADGAVPFGQVRIEPKLTV